MQPTHCYAVYVLSASAILVNATPLPCLLLCPPSPFPPLPRAPLPRHSTAASSCARDEPAPSPRPVLHWSLLQHCTLEYVAVMMMEPSEKVYVEGLDVREARYEVELKVAQTVVRPVPS